MSKLKSWRLLGFMLNVSNYYWSKIENAVRELVYKLQQIENIENYRKIYCIGRGGLVPTRLLSGAMGIKRIGFIDLDDLRTVLPIEPHPLICDDIFDTGATHKTVAAKVRYPEAVFAYLFIRHTMVTKRPPNVVFGHVVRDDNYIIFPWEVSKDD